jgi:cell division protein FtsB
MQSFDCTLTLRRRRRRRWLLLLLLLLQLQQQLQCVFARQSGASAVTTAAGATPFDRG